MLDVPTKLRILEKFARSKTVGAKLHGLKGNSPDLHLRSLNRTKCFKGSETPEIVRRLAQKQLSFKKCVIAY